MNNFFASLFDTFQPHGQCLLWNPKLLWLFVISDLLITLAYYSIPVSLFYFVRRRQDLQFGWIFLMFAGFIWACGTTHAMAVFTLWTPAYWIEGFVKLGAAIISVITAVQLWPLIPKALAIPSSIQLEAMNRELQLRIVEKEKAESDLAMKVEELARSQEELQRQNSILQSILNAMNDGVAVVDEDRTYIVANPASERILGKNLLGRRIGEIGFKVYDDEQQNLTKIPPIIRALNREAVHDEEKFFVSESGAGHWLSINAAPVMISTDELAGAVAVYRDITPRKHAEEQLRTSEARFRSIFEHAAVGIVLFDINGKIIEANDTLGRILGYTREELQNLSIQDYIHPDDVEQYRMHFSQLVNGERSSYQAEKRYIRKDRSHTWVRATVSFVRSESNAPMFGIKMVEDITERRHAEDRMKYYAGELERSNSDLEQFAYVASHDLREPLRMVTSYVQLLSKQYGAKLDDEAREYIHYAVDGAKRMRMLIESLLEYSRVSTGPLELQNIPAEELIERAKENLAALIAENSAGIITKDLPSVNVSPIQFIQVFQNLFANSMKFRKSGEAPGITVEAEDQGACWQFIVRDNGIGMEPQFAERIFVLFQRLHSHTDYPGTGIGLSVVKKIIERHGGKIWVESEPEKGAAFFFTIPK